MKKLIYLLIAFALLFSSCRATRQTVRTETVANETVQFDISTKKVETVQETSQQTAVCERNIELDIDETIISVQFSAPDSLGNQHVVSATQIVRALRSIERNTATIETEQTRQSETVETLNDNTIFETNYHSVSKIETKKQPVWQLVFGFFVFSIFLLAVVFLTILFVK